MTKYVCVPLYLFPNERIEFTRCEVVPGVKVQRISKALTEFVRQQNDKIPPGHRPSFFSSHVIMIELQKHFDYLTALLGQEGRQIPKHPFEKNNIERSELYVEADSVTRHVVMPLVLTGGLQFRVGGYHTLKVNTVHKMPKYIASGYSHHISEGSYLQNPFSSIDAMDSTNSRLLKKTAKGLQRYYRSYSWWNDRFGIALGHFWNALCTPHLDHAFVGLSMALEAVLSTGRDEISHRVGERVAILLENDAEKRLETYKLVKRLYGTRSRLVHGAARQTKGKLTTESLAMSAKMALVPISQGKLLSHLVVAVLRALLEDRSYLSIVQNTKSEGTTDRKIDELFTSRVLGHAN